MALLVLLLGLGAWNLWEGDTFSGIGCVFGATVVLWLVHRNYRIARGLGSLPVRDSDRGDVNRTKG